MRIQLLHPPTHVAAGVLQTATPTPPLGLAYIAGALRQAGHEVVVLDALAAAPSQKAVAGSLTRLGLSDEQILERLDPSAQAIGVGNMFSFNWSALCPLLHAIRKRYPDKYIVCGGEHCSALPELCMRTAPIDYIVMGEGEEIAVELFARLGAGVPFDTAAVKGLCWRRGDEVVINPRAQRTRDVDAIPWPAWDLFDLDAYNDNDLVDGVRLGSKTMPILATRGCPYQCTYCASPQMWTTRWYARDPVDVADEIEHYVRRYGANNFPFQDLTMILRKEWIVRFCNEIIARRLDVRWQLPTGTRCDVVDAEVASLLYRSGCRFLCYAPESGSERTRQLIKKKMATSNVLRAITESAKAKLRLQTFLVIGFPHDTRDDLAQTVRFLRRIARLGVEDIAIHFFFPLPGTELFAYLEKTGRLQLGDAVLTTPLFAHAKRLREASNYCEHLTAAQLTRWKYWMAANFYLTAWVTHPGRPLRILVNVLRGRQTTPLEKFLSVRVARRVRRARWWPRLPALNDAVRDTRVAP